MKTTLLLLFTISIIGAARYTQDHDHSGHSWLGDKSAFKYNTIKVKTLEKSLELKSHKKMLALGIDEYISEIDEQYLRNKLEMLSGSTVTTLGDTIRERKTQKGKSFALNFLASEFEKNGFVVTRQKLKTSGFPRGEVINLIAEKKSTHPDAGLVILTAHYDSVGNSGANDNGSGTIGTLAIAKSLSKQTFKHTLRIVAFDKEETGLKGSKAFVKALSTEDKARIIGNINFEMMGTNSRDDGVFHIIDCDREDSKHLTNAVIETISDFNLPITNNPGCTDRSDHASFWKAGIPAIVISENFFGGDSDRCYHKRCDVVDDRLNFSYMKNITHAVYGAVSTLLQ